MAATSPARGRAATGVVAGFVLRLARESIPRTQSAMAEHLEVDLGTVQGWESGRRPLGNMKAAALLSLRRRLGAMGAAPGVLGLLDPAMDADQIISAALDPAGWQAHPLASWVHTRDTAHMLAWALTGVAPSALARYVPAPRPAEGLRSPLRRWARGTGCACSIICGRPPRRRGDRATHCCAVRRSTSRRTTAVPARCPGRHTPCVHGEGISYAEAGRRSGRKPARRQPLSHGWAIRNPCWTSSRSAWWTMRRPKPPI